LFKFEVVYKKKIAAETPN